jgi:hypothetical protein
VSTYTRGTKAATGSTAFGANTTLTAAELNTDFDNAKTAIDDNDSDITAINLEIDRMPWGTTEETLTISSGSVTPNTTGHVLIDTEGSAATDDLDQISATNWSQGQILLVGLANTARIVTLRHNTGSSPKIVTADGQNIRLNDLKQKVLLQYNGTDWDELDRWGSEEPRRVNDIGFSTDWADGASNLFFWKDRDGFVHIEGMAQGTTISTSFDRVFTLPAEYRTVKPGGTYSNRYFPAISAISGGFEINSIYIDDNGEVFWAREPESNSAPSANVVLYFDIKFFALA